MNLSDLHDCEKSRGKLVMIEADNVGVTRCGYCQKITDYVRYFREKLTNTDGLHK